MATKPGIRVRQALLALLAAGSAHGYRLKADYERLTGSGPVNVGQIYTTLDRLARDGLVVRDPTEDDAGRVAYHITAAGRAAAKAWLLDASGLVTNGRSAVAGKVLLALGVADVNAVEVIDAHRLALIAEASTVRRRVSGLDTDPVDRLVLEAQVAVTEAELRWLDLCEDALAQEGWS